MSPRRSWSVLGVPIDCSGNSRGEERGPAALREAGLVDRLEARDLGDVDAYMHDPQRDPGTGVIGFETVRVASERIRDRVRTELDAGTRLLVVGGCCTLIPGLMAGVRDAAPGTGLAFVDGHLDFYDGATSDTGEAADMDLALLTGHGPDGLIDLGAPPPIVDPATLIVVGHRDDVVRKRLGAAEPAEVEPAIELIHASELAARDPAEVGRAALEHVERRGGRFWLHLDLDVLDADAFPAVTYPQPDGPDWDALTALLEPLTSSPALLGVNVTDFNADRDPDGRHARRVIDLLKETLLAASPA